MKLQEEDDCFLLIDRDYFESSSRTSPQPRCYMYIGMLENLMEWVIGHRHKVTEIKYRSVSDDADILKISKKAEK
ncbi:MAG: hypothetical protein HXS52_05400 [Theionarchaea archaeon]|nr:hypothetical protein [Theionarchaea archaeon]